MSAANLDAKSVEKPATRGIMQVCPGYISREDTKLIETDPSKTEKVNCALCGAIVKAIFKSGGWTIQKHTAPPNPSFLLTIEEALG